MVIVVGMDTATRVQILDEIDCISHSTNTLRKDMNPIILPPAIVFCLFLDFNGISTSLCNSMPKLF